MPMQHGLEGRGNLSLPLGERPIKGRKRQSAAYPPRQQTAAVAKKKEDLHRYFKPTESSTLPSDVGYPSTSVQSGYLGAHGRPLSRVSHAGGTSFGSEDCRPCSCRSCQPKYRRNPTAHPIFKKQDGEDKPHHKKHLDSYFEPLKSTAPLPEVHGSVQSGITHDAPKTVKFDVNIGNSSKDSGNDTDFGKNERRTWGDVAFTAGKYAAVGALTVGAISGGVYAFRNPSLITDYWDTNTLQSAYRSTVGTIGNTVTSAASKFGSMAGSAFSGISNRFSSVGSAATKASSWWSGARDTAASQSVLSVMPSAADITSHGRSLAGGVFKGVVTHKIANLMRGQGKPTGSTAGVTTSGTTGGG